MAQSANAKKFTAILSTPEGRYAMVVESAFRMVQGRVSTGRVYTPTAVIAAMVADDLAATHRDVFGAHGRKHPRLKPWRVMTILSNARYLGFYEAAGMWAVPGRGLTSEAVSRKPVLRSGSRGRP